MPQSHSPTQARRQFHHQLRYLCLKMIQLSQHHVNPSSEVSHTVAESFRNSFQAQPASNSSLEEDTAQSSSHKTRNWTQLNPPHNIQLASGGPWSTQKCSAPQEVWATAQLAGQRASRRIAPAGRRRPALDSQVSASGSGLSTLQITRVRRLWPFRCFREVTRRSVPAPAAGHGCGRSRLEICGGVSTRLVFGCHVSCT